MKAFYYWSRYLPHRSRINYYSWQFTQKWKNLPQQAIDWRYFFVLRSSLQMKYIATIVDSDHSLNSTLAVDHFWKDGPFCILLCLTPVNFTLSNADLLRQCRATHSLIDWMYCRINKTNTGIAINTTVTIWTWQNLHLQL